MPTLPVSPRLAGLCLCLLPLACVLESGGAPLKEQPVTEEVLLSFAHHSRAVDFKAHEEARVIVSGGVNAPIGLYVFDANGNCVAWDDFGGNNVQSDCAVLFVPPADGRYTVEVRSFASAPMTCTVAIR